MKFREVAEAYAVLSDDLKRREYDATGHAGVSERWSSEDLFRDFQFGDFFGGRFDDLAGVFGDLFGGRIRSAPGSARGLDLRYDLDLSLEDAASGGERELEITRSDTCALCHGTGAKVGTAMPSCPKCSGTGQQRQMQVDKGVRLVTVTVCGTCGGRGRVIDSPCPACDGGGIQFKPHTLKVRLPPGIHSGMTIRLPGQGEAHSAGGSPGDLLIRPHIRPHPYLDRHGDDLYTVAKISFSQAALGIKIRVSGLGGETVQVNVPAGTQSGTALRLRGKGMPRWGGKGKGDLLVVTEVLTPTNLSPKQKTLLEELAKLESIH